MSEPNIKKNFIYRLLYEVLILITPFITMPYISRILGADGIGIHSYASSIMTYFTLVAALGTSSYGTREISRNREDQKIYSKIFWEIELMTVMSTIVCLIGWIIFITVNADYTMIFLALTPSLFAVMFDISWFYMGHEKIIYSIIWNAVCKILGIVFLFIFVRHKSDLIVYTLINSSVILFGNISMWIFLPKLLCRIDFRALSFKRHFQEAFVYFIPTVATTIYTVLDKTLINIITGDVFQNGYYEQATKIINMIKTIVFVSINAVMGARISYLFTKEKYDEIRIRISKSMNFILLIGYGCVFGIIGVAKNFVQVFFGNGYEPVVSLLYIMSVLIIIIGISNCLGTQYYTPSGKRKESAKYIVIGSIINLFLNIVLIPYFGAKGATVASIVAEMFISILYIGHCNKIITLNNIFNYSWKRIIAGIFMCIVIILLETLHVKNPIILILFQVCSGILIYGIILIFLKDTILKEIIIFIKNYIKIISYKFHR